MAEAVDRGDSRASIIWWSRRAPAWARVSPISCRPSWPAAGRQDPRTSRPPRGRFHAYDQPARAVDGEGPAAAAQRDSAGVLGRAGQGAGQLPQPAAVGKRPGRARPSVQRARGVRATAAARTPGRRRRATARWRTWIFARCRRCGTKWPAITATAWAARARSTASVSTTKPGGGCKTPRSWWSTTPCSSPTWPCGAQEVSILPKYDVVIFDEAHTHRGRGRRPSGPEHHQRPGRVHAAAALQRPHQSRAAGPPQAGARPRKQVWECRDRAADFFDERGGLAGPPQPTGQRPRPRRPASWPIR